MSNFDERPRFPLEEIRAFLKTAYGAIFHIIENEDKTYSLMSHINCEWCDYCDEQCSIKNENMIHKAKSDPYEIQKIKFPENYGLVKKT